MCYSAIYIYTNFIDRMLFFLYYKIFLWQKEQEMSADHSSVINKAYQTLAQPLPRAEYLLSLQGKGLHEEEVRFL